MVERRPRSLAEIARNLEQTAALNYQGVFQDVPSIGVPLLLEALEKCAELVHMKSNQAALTRIIAAYRGEG